MAKLAKRADSRKRTSAAKPALAMLRFTGELPTEAAIRQFPNWEYAFDEEGLPGQDETTLRPSQQQSRIDSDTDYSAAVGVTPDGTELTVLLRSDGSVMHESPGGIDGMRVFRGRTVYDLELFADAWMPDDNTPVRLGCFDPGMLPLRVTSVLPGSASRKKRHEIVLMPDGELLDGKEAREATFTYPDPLRSSQLIKGARDHLLGTTTFTIYKGLKNGKAVGLTEQTITRAKDGALRLEKRDRLGQGTLVIDALFDERTLVLRSISSEYNGKTYAYSATGNGASSLPKNVVTQEDVVLQCAPLAEEWRALLRGFSSVRGAVHNCVATVEAREAAPGHPDSMAWRVLLEGGERMQQRYWIDTESRQVLAYSVSSDAILESYLSVRDSLGSPAPAAVPLRSTPTSRRRS